MHLALLGRQRSAKKDISTKQCSAILLAPAAPAVVPAAIRGNIFIARILSVPSKLSANRPIQPSLLFSAREAARAPLDAVRRSLASLTAHFRPVLGLRYAI